MREGGASVGAGWWRRGTQEGEWGEGGGGGSEGKLTPSGLLRRTHIDQSRHLRSDPAPPPLPPFPTSLHPTYLQLSSRSFHCGLAAEPQNGQHLELLDVFPLKLPATRRFPPQPARVPSPRPLAAAEAGQRGCLKDRCFTSQHHRPAPAVPPPPPPPLPPLLPAFGETPRCRYLCLVARHSCGPP